MIFISISGSFLTDTLLQQHSFQNKQTTQRNPYKKKYNFYKFRLVFATCSKMILKRKETSISNQNVAQALHRQEGLYHLLVRLKAVESQEKSLENLLVAPIASINANKYFLPRMILPLS